MPIQPMPNNRCPQRARNRKKLCRLSTCRTSLLLLESFVLCPAKPRARIAKSTLAFSHTEKRGKRWTELLCTLLKKGTDHFCLKRGRTSSVPTFIRIKTTGYRKRVVRY